MSRQGIHGRIVLTACAIVAALVLVACGSTVSGHPRAENSGAATTAASVTSLPPTIGSTAPTSVDRSGTDFEATIGDCVKLGGTISNATIEKAACGSENSNFKVIGKAAENSQCPSDVDQAYYETRAGREQGALCLDIDWVIGGCMDLGNDDPERVDCTARGTTKAVKVVEIKQSTTDVDDCTSGDRGFVYGEREFVVCVNGL